MTARHPAAARAPHSHAGAHAASHETLQVDYQAATNFQERGAVSAADWHSVLGAVAYGEAASALALPEHIPFVSVASEPLDGRAGCIELWRLGAAGGGSALQSGRHGAIRYRHGSRLLFASLVLPEQAPGAAAPTAVPALQWTTQRAYTQLFDALRAVGFPHPLRTWNYLSDLTAEHDGAARYAHFNAGRQDAFLLAGRELAGDVPAASVLGVRGSEVLTLYCLAAREAPLPVENPRQCSAWDYPREYSERRPTFARACVDRSGNERLFISGTASILGHRSAHHGDPVEQTHETLRNIRALLAAANERVGADRFSEQDLAYKIYVRDPQQYTSIERVLRKELGDLPERVFLRADVCRPELLVEIEATSVGAAP
jgi:enamine deaminase RidA (YjgF/YER057c/UK114 family)